MAGSVSGGKKAAQTNYEKYGKDFYRNIGRKGGSAICGMKGFALNPQLAREAGRKGGLVSKRGKSIKKDKEEQ